MNIFVTNKNPVIAAQELDDKRISHMPKEFIEMLTCYIHFMTGIWYLPFPLWGNEDRSDAINLYNHPVNKWVRQDKANVWWLYRHLEACFTEYSYRFDSVNPIQRYQETIKSFIIEHPKEPTWFQNSSLYKREEVVKAYRDTMINKWTVTDKIKPVKFTKRGKPVWFV